MGMAGKGLNRWMVAGAALWLWGAGCSSAPEVAEDESAVEAPQEAAEQVDSDYLPVGESPIMGDRAAPITVVEFSSMQCPFSGRAAATTRALVEENPGDVRLVFKHFPLDMQRQSEEASRAVEAAGRQGDEAFWAMRDALFERLSDYEDQSMEELGAQVAAGLELDEEQWRQDFHDPEVAERVQEDQQQGLEMGVQGTPLFAVNGVVVSGAQSLEVFQEVVDEQKEVIDELRDEGVAEEELYAHALERNLEAAMAEAEAQQREAERRAEEAEAQPPEVRSVPIRQANHSRGADADDALVTIVEFSSFPCPFCREGSAAMDELLERYPDELRVVFKHFPLDFQEQAMPASLAAQAAGEQDHFWEMYDLIYAHQSELHDDIYAEFANELGLDEERFEADMESAAIQEVVEQDLEDGQQAGVRGTPAFTINGVRENGAQPVDTFAAHVEEQMELAREVQEETGLSGEELHEAVIEANKSR